MIEFFTDRQTGQAMYRIDSGAVKELTEKDTYIIENLLERSKEFYPKQYEALEDVYGKSSINKSYYDFLRARRIINCCFGEYDSKTDIDSKGHYNFEIVKCPLIAECKHYKIICQPQFESSLTESEIRVMKLVFNGKTAEEIADALFLSVHTINNHRRNALQRLGLKSIDEFIRYAQINNLFKD